MELNNQELNNIREAANLTCKRLEECFKSFHLFKTEKDVKDFLKKDFELSFPTIVASGSGASQPHYEGNKNLENGFCVIDFGIKHKGICSDMTRMVYIGKPTKKEINTYNSLLQKHQKLLKMVKPNQKLRYLDKILRRWLGSDRKKFIHLLGHGLGKVVHEKCNKKLKFNECITIEPGLYVNNEWGIRIEDMVLGSGEVLTKTSKQLIIKPTISHSLK